MSICCKCLTGLKGGRYVEWKKKKKNQDFLYNEFIWKPKLSMVQPWSSVWNINKDNQNIQNKNGKHEQNVAFWPNDITVELLLKS